MIPAELAHYLTMDYRQHVLGKNVDARHAIEDNAAFRAALEQQRTRLRKLASKTGDLSQRDFVSYQHLRAIEAALAILEDKPDAS